MFLPVLLSPGAVLPVLLSPGAFLPVLLSPGAFLPVLLSPGVAHSPCVCPVPEKTFFFFPFFSVSI
jgi:hypothetical protein